MSDRFRSGWARHGALRLFGDMSSPERINAFVSRGRGLHSQALFDAIGGLLRRRRHSVMMDIEVTCSTGASPALNRPHNENLIAWHRRRVP